MFLKRLTMKGFKSFADTTVLEFEPGVTAVVGPNGSGKSNVVDAVTWVLGAQSTRALRSAKMEDVIFAGTVSRAALGRCEVSLTLDNASGKLSIDGAEVTISRTLFRSGESEYAINATPCRLLDIQELLGDSGVGRQQHMIIGQGQLDSVLNSRGEDRRAVIEEAAGVLKHRRRKERAERRLAGTQENLERLGDLVREVRRQMRPLERQAVAARSYADIEADLRQARRYSFSTRLSAHVARQRQLDEELRSASQLERELRHELITLDAQATTAAAEVASRREELLASTLGALQGLAERARGTESLIVERQRSLRAALAASADENVIATLEADAAKLAADLVELERDETHLLAQRDELTGARAMLAEAEDQYNATWGDSFSANPADQLAAARDRVEILERSLASATDAMRRVSQRLDEVAAREQDALARLNRAADELKIAESAVHERRGQLEEAERESSHTEAQRQRADETFRELSDVAARTQARAEALSRALDELSGAGSRALIAQLDGVLGAFLDLIDVDPGAERAVESAAGASLSAVVVDGRRSAREALETIRREGGAGLVLPAFDESSEVHTEPPGCVALRSRVRARAGAPAHVERVLDALFARAFVAADWESGIETAVSHPHLIIVTPDGDRFASSGWRVASGRAVVTRSTVDEATSAASVAASELPAAKEARERAGSLVSEARRFLSERNAALLKQTAEFERLTRERARLETLISELSEQSAVLLGERGEVENELIEVTVHLESELSAVPLLERAVQEAAQRASWATEALTTLTAHRDQVSELATALSRREAEFGERRRLIGQRRVEVESRLEGHSVERAEAASRREKLEFDIAALGRLALLVRNAAEEIALSQSAMASTYREQLEASRAGAERLEALRRQRSLSEGRLSELSETARRADIEHAEVAVKISNLHESIHRDLGEEPDTIFDAEAPELGDDVSIEQRLAELEARMSSLGPINPLALEELTALEERYKDLDAQVSDVRHARRELQEVLRALDDEIMATFSAAVADVNEHFSSLIATLFPGGQGRLILTEPDDPLNTGVEIEVRPMGRNVRRVSLLSGGERSMAALAFLFAVFRSRPSPFYLMDEVEAALDDVNLQRFLSLLDEFRTEAQMLVVTHQKRTMEAADALYGVTMAPGGSSKVVSQRVQRNTRELLVPGVAP
jgi:chromosome segregation protein